MRQHYGILCLLLVFILGYQTQDPTTPTSDWNGDPRLCTANSPPTPPPGPVPQFPKFDSKAEFAIELIQSNHLFNATLPSQLTLFQYIYDYDANKLIVVKNANGVITVDFYYYEILNKSTYFAGQYCVVSEIPQNIDIGMFISIYLHIFPRIFLFLCE